MPGRALFIPRHKFEGVSVLAGCPGGEGYVERIGGLGESNFFCGAEKLDGCDGEPCALNANGVPAFSRLQAATDKGGTDQLVFYAFDLVGLLGSSK